MENSKEKQIDEMAKVIEQARIKATDTTNSMNYGFGGWYAKELYNAGYRKASEVAREIFAEIENIILAGISKDEHFREQMNIETDRSYFEGGANSQRKVLTLVRQLKKEYLEVDENDDI